MVAGGVVYHYTSRQAAQDILAMGRLLPYGTLARIWLSPIRYASGAEAANRLAILGKTVEVAVEIPRTMIDNPTVSSLVLAEFNLGLMVRQGLGWEFSIQHDILVAGLLWLP